MFDIQTNAGRPVKMPMPPRIWFFWSPVASQLNPTRYDSICCPDGMLDVFLPKSARISGFVGGFWPKLGISTLRPYVSVSRLVAFHSSCTYAESCWADGDTMPLVPLAPTPTLYAEGVPAASESRLVNCQYPKMFAPNTFCHW